jgi:hypothetical protein
MTSLNYTAQLMAWAPTSPGTSQSTASGSGAVDPFWWLSVPLWAGLFWTGIALAGLFVLLLLLYLCNKVFASSSAKKKDDNPKTAVA